MKPRNVERISRILGVGFDDGDGHIRITQGKDFEVRQGSPETHEKMQHVCMLIEQRLQESGRRLQDLTKDEFIELVSDLDDS